MLEWWQERLPRRPVLVVPTGPDTEDMSAEMARRAGGLVGQSAAVAFAGLVQLVLGRPFQLASDFERILLVSQLLGDTALEVIYGAARLPGVAVSLATLLLEFGESGRNPEEIDAILEQWALAEPEAAAVARDIRRLAAAYARVCGRLRLLDHPSAVREAVRCARGWDRPVAFYGFTSFTRGQRLLMAELATRAEILVTLAHQRGRDLTMCALEEVDWWTGRACQVVELNPRTRAYASPAIAYLEKHFMKDKVPFGPPRTREEAGGVRFLLASGRSAEAELAAQHISELILSGLDPGGIAVVVRRVQTWGGLLADVFASCGIPCQIDDRRCLGESGLGYAFLEALRGRALDDPEGTLCYLRSPYSGVAVEEVCDLELRFRQGTARSTQTLTHLAEREVLAACEPVWALVGAGGGGPGSSGRGDNLPAASGRRLDLAAAGSLAERMLLAGARGAAAGSRELEEDARAFRAMKTAFATMARVAGQDDLRGCLEPQAALRLLSQVGLSGSSHADPQVVQVLSAQRARARRFQAVFVLGLVEGEFPASPDASSLLSAEQRARLDSLGGGLFPPETEGESALFVGAASRAWQLLFLSARDAEDDGTEAVPSRFWESAKALLAADRDGREGRTLADQVFAPESAPSPRHYLRACAAGGRAPHPDVQAPEPPLAASPWRRVPARLKAPGILAELETMESFSPSALESYACCPFAWFVERVVGAEDVELELDGRMVGELIHRALSECYQALALSSLLPVVPENAAEAGRRAVAIIDDLVQGADCPGTFAQRRVAAWRLKSMARRLFEMEASSGSLLTFVEAEAGIGGRRGVDIGGLLIRGRVDRVDSTRDGRGLFVFDYKSGAGPTVSALGTDEGLQLPLYLMALAAERDDADVVGGAYVSLSTGELSGVVKAGSEWLLGSRADKLRALDEAGWQELLERSRAVAQAAAADMRAGVIAPRSGRACPSWCRLGPVCRSQRGGYRP